MKQQGLPQKHLAVLLPTLQGGGAERTMLKLAGGFASRGYHVDLVLVSGDGPLRSEIPEQLRVIDLKSPRWFTSRAFSSIPALVAYLRSEAPEILYTGLMTNLVALWARKLSRTATRVVISERNILSAEIRQFRKDIRFRLMPLMLRIFYPWADGIVAVSQAVADDINRISNIPKGKIKVIYNPVVSSSLASKSSSVIDHPWFYPDQPPVILAVGRLVPQKDYPTLIRAFVIVRQQSSARLIILGEGPERAKLEKLIEESGLQASIALPGFIENPCPYMKKARVFVHPARFEGLPGSVIEALYCGAAVIATDCPGGLREILDDGKYGQLVPPGDPVAMANAIESCLSASAHPVSEQSWKPFELDTVLDQYTALFAKISSAAG